MIHENALKRLSIIKQEKRPISILLENDKCVVCESGCQKFDNKREMTIMEIMPEENCFITSDEEKHYFTLSSEIHCSI